MPHPANKLISSLIEHGGTLSRSLLLSDTKTIHDDVISLIPTILNEIENAQLPAFFPEKAIPKVLDKIQAILLKLKESDSENARDYEQLVTKVNDCKFRKQQTSAVGSSSSFSLPPTGDYQGSTTAHDVQQDQFGRLTAEEKKCLFCFCLFSSGEEVKKREPIHLWVALDLVVDPLAGVEMLAKLVAQGFIDRTIRNNKLCNRYKMNEHVHSMIVDAMNINFTQDRSLCIMDQKKHKQQQPQEQSPSSHQQEELKQEQASSQQPGGQQHQQEPLPQQTTILKRLASNIIQKNEDDTDGLGTLVLNRSEDTLQASTFERISKLKSNVKVLHLGSWLHNSERYIVVDQEAEALKGLTKHLGEVTFLSLEGISGIVKLPDSVYKLENLKVLDLRGCPNLESLPEGIDSMKRLTHLDLSECYLLDHFPKGIASLTELRVLKGFVINPQEDSQVGNERNGDRNKDRKETLCASFSELRALEKLIKLTIRTRRTNFPTSDDFDTLCAMKMLTNLRVAWVWNSTNVPTVPTTSGRFPASLKKLELQAAPENTMLRLLRRIGEDPHNSLQKLYIRGGKLWNLGMQMQNFRHVQIVRLRYLPELHIDWDEFRMFFPNLTRLEVLGCPNLIFFPCDQYGAWERN